MDQFVGLMGQRLIIDRNLIIIKIQPKGKTKNYGVLKKMNNSKFSTLQLKINKHPYGFVTRTSLYFQLLKMEKKYLD